MQIRDRKITMDRCDDTPTHDHSVPIETTLRTRIDDGGKALVPFLTAGFPDTPTFVALLREAESAGCDVIEVGLPFSDPIADGPTIQYASQHSLDNGMTIPAALDAITDARLATPLVLMGYLNPILAYSPRRFVNDAQQAGVCGVIVPDLPLTTPATEASCDIDLTPLCTNWERILLAAPTTTDDRLAAIGRATRGFLYAVTVTGVTGARSALPAQTAEFLTRARAATSRPVLAGFGIGDAQTARKIARHCDGVIIGSALIDLIRNGPRNTAVKRFRRFLKGLRDAL